MRAVFLASIMAIGLSVAGTAWAQNVAVPQDNNGKTASSIFNFFFAQEAGGNKYPSILGSISSREPSGLAASGYFQCGDNVNIVHK